MSTLLQPHDCLLEHLSQGILFINDKGTITFFNPSAAKLLGFSQNQILNTLFSGHFSDDFLGFSLLAALKEKQSLSSRYISPLPEHILEVEANYFHDGLIILIRDVTEMRKLQSIAQRNDRLKELGELAAMVAHEIRNPLGGIKGFASLLERDLKDKPELQQMATYIVEGAENLNQLINHILNYSRPLTLKFELIDIIPLLSDIITIIEADETLRKNYGVNIISSHEHLYVWVDPHLLKSAVLNLVMNGCQAMPEGGTVTIELTQQQQTCIIQVIDHGEGIPDEHLSKLFTPFFTTKIGGNGFGLVEVQKVVQAHDGLIEVHSELHKGTIFTLTLPNKVSHGN